jgi:hypothetical protein
MLTLLTPFPHGASWRKKNARRWSRMERMELGKLCDELHLSIYEYWRDNNGKEPLKIEVTTETHWLLKANTSFGGTINFHVDENGEHLTFQGIDVVPIHSNLMFRLVAK